MTPTSSVGNNERGVTLIEMLVVMVVISLIVAVSTPSITAGLDAIRLVTATSSVAAFLNTAATKAERKQRPVELTIAGDKLKFLVGDGSHQELTLPDGIAIHSISANPLEDAQAVTQALFLPGGAVPAMALELTNQHGGRRVIRLDPMTGFPRVENIPGNNAAAQPEQQP